MPRNIVICCDGTNNQFGPENTNVVRLTQVLDRDPANQVLYYDPGVGTLPELGVLTRLGKWLSKVMGLAFGAGLTGKVEEAYAYLMDFWEPGDRVFLFGFSRGAYTARVLAGMLHSLGLLPRGNQNLVPYVMRLYKAVRKAGKVEEDNSEHSYWKLCREFRWTFSRQVPGGGDDRRFRVHFLGLWDTVSSVGWVWDPVKFPYTAHNPSVGVIRHAVSVDERRWFFRQNLMQQMPGQDFQEQWFPGVHCDVGGGYPEAEGGLWRLPFGWILDEAQKAGLLVNQQRLHVVLNRTPPSSAPWKDPQHESLKGLWWLAEVFPKLVWEPSWSRRVPEMGLGRYRFIHNGALVHKSGLLRIRDIDYAPPNLSMEFLERARRLENVPDSLPYEQ
jgi:uncharacterized protein (DUF2235 family)